MLCRLLWVVEGQAIESFEQKVHGAVGIALASSQLRRLSSKIFQAGHVWPFTNLA